MKYGQLTALLICAAATLHAGPVTVTFEGLQNGESILDYYNGGTGSLGSAGGPSQNYGISFDGNPFADALVQISAGGTGNFGGSPSPVTAMNIGAASPAIMDVAAGFTSLSFWYSDPTVGGDQVKIFDAADGGNGSGNVIASVTLPTTPTADSIATGGSGDNCMGLGAGSDPGALYCPFELVTITVGSSSGPSGFVDNFGNGIDPTQGTNGVGYSVDFGGAANFILYDNISVNECDATQSQCPQYVPPCTQDCPQLTPEPSTWLLFATGGLLMLFGSRKLKLRKS